MLCKRYTLTGDKAEKSKTDRADDTHPVVDREWMEIALGRHSGE